MVNNSGAAAWNAAALCCVKRDITDSFGGASHEKISGTG